MKSTFTILLTTLLFSCTIAPTQQNDTIIIEPQSETLKLSAVFKSHELIVFKGILIGDIIDFIETKDYYILQTINETSDLLLFDKNGDYIQPLVNKGRANNEALNIIDVNYCNKTNSLSVLADYGMKIFEYSLDTKEITATIKTPKSILVAKSAIKLDDDRFIYYKDLSYCDDQEYKLYVYNFKQDTIENQFLPLNKATAEYVSFGQKNNLYEKDGEIHFYEAFDDNIYKVNKDSLSTHIIFDKKELGISNEDLNRGYKGFDEFLNFCLDGGYIYAHTNCIQYQDKIFSWYRVGDQSYCNIADIATQKSQSYTTINDDLISNTTLKLGIYTPLSADKNGIYWSVDPTALRGIMQNPTALNEIGDNTIIIRFK